MTDTTPFASFVADRQPVWNGTIFVDPSTQPQKVGGDDHSDQSLLDAARRLGWRDAAKAAFGTDLMNYVDNPSRLIFLDLLDLKPTDKILEIGPGLGQLSIPIARLVKSVDAIEIDPNQAAFCAERARQEEITNARFIAGGDNCLLPFADGSFDGVILNLVLEWCGLKMDDMSHEEAHVRLLGEIYRVLKPNGFLYLVTKNRFSLRCLTGGRDEHLGNMRFGSALPRGLAKLLLRGNRAKGHLHSYNELSALLISSGFGCLRSYWLAPEMRWPTRILPLDTDLTQQRRQGGFAEGENRRTEALMRLIPSALVKHFTPGLAFVARKQKD